MVVGSYSSIVLHNTYYLVRKYNPRPMAVEVGRVVVVVGLLHMPPRLDREYELMNKGVLLLLLLLLL